MSTISHISRLESPSPTTKTTSERANLACGTEESGEGRGCSSCRKLVAEDEVLVLWMEDELVERARDVMANGCAMAKVAMQRSRELSKSGIVSRKCLKYCQMRTALFLA